MNHFIIGTAGHVDHGKTSLIRALTGKDLDTHAEEKRRGITINNGYASVHLPNGSTFCNEAGIIDVPGHKDFVRQMIAGAGGMDLAILVIAADSGPEAQSLEHLQILQGLEVKKILPVLTRIDLLNEKELETSRLLTEEFLEAHGVKTEGEINAISAKTGLGVEELKERLSNELRFLAEDYNTSQNREIEKNKVFRLWIDRSFSIEGQGTVVTGTVSSGVYDVSKELWLYPRNQKIAIKSLQRHSQACEQIDQGDRAALRVANLNKDEIRPGMLLSSETYQLSSRVDAVFQAFQKQKIPRRKIHLQFCCGSLSIACRTSILDADSLSDEQEVLMQVDFDEELALIPGEIFILRDLSRKCTVGSGRLLDTHYLHHKRRKSKAVDALRKLKSGGLVELIAQKVYESRYFLTLKGFFSDICKTNSERSS